MAPANDAKDGHCCGMRAGHLDHESTFNLVAGFRAFDEGETRVYGGLGDSAKRQPSGRPLFLMLATNSVAITGRGGFPPDLPCALILGERVIEGGFFIGEAGLLAASRAARMSFAGC